MNMMIICTLGFLLKSRIFLGTAPFGQQCTVSVIKHLTPTSLTMQQKFFFSHLRAKLSSSHITMLFITSI
jgi:hypothetical protein